MRFVLRHVELGTAAEFLRQYQVPVLDFIGDPGVLLLGYPYLCPLDAAVPGSVSFLYFNRDNANWASQAARVGAVKKSRAALVLVDARLENVEVTPGKAIAFVEDPRACFMQLLRRFAVPARRFYEDYSLRTRPNWGPNVVVELGAVVGETTILEGNNYIHANTCIGEHVIVKSGAVIGGSGFGFLTADGHHQLVPHIGGVIIEDDVMIGSNTCVDCGVLGNTVIRRGARIDNLVHIAHNVEVGENAMVIANAMVAGSVKIGKGAQISPSVSIRQHLTIGDDAVVGMHSCVTKGVAPQTLVYGVPAKECGSSVGKKLEDNR